MENSQHLHRFLLERRKVRGLLFGLSLLLGLVMTSVSSGISRQGDEAVLLSLREQDSPEVLAIGALFHGPVRDLTSLGSVYFIILTSAFFITVFWTERHWSKSIFLTMTICSGLGVAEFLKAVFQRERPSIVPHLMEVHSYSFPSAHSFGAALLFFTLAAILVESLRFVTSQRVVWGTAFLLVFTVGMSRLLLGVHYPTDVLAGWLAGTIWFLICWQIWRPARVRRPL